MRTKLTELLGIQYPIFQGGMAWVSEAILSTAVSNAGGAGMIASGCNPDTDLVEIVEIKNHPFFIGVQFHPELKSTVESPAPLFVKFVEACKVYNSTNIKEK